VKALTIAWNDIRIVLREPAIWLNLVVIPAALIFVIGLANGQSLGSGELPRYRVDVVDLDGSPQSGAYIQALQGQNDTLVICPAQNDAEDFCQVNTTDGGLTGDTATTRLNDGISLAAVEIPAGFGAALLAGEEATVVYRSAEDVSASSAALQAVNTAAQRLKGVISSERIAAHIAEATLDGDATFVDSVRERAGATWAGPPVTIAVTEAERMDPDFLVGIQQSVPGMGGMYVMFLVLAGAGTLVQERKLWTLQRLAAAPVTKADIILGKLLARFVLGMGQFAVAFGVGMIFGRILDVSFGNNLLALVVIMVAFALCVSTLTLLLATFVKSEAQAGSLVTLVTLILAPLGGAWWSLDFEFIPEFMRTISNISPFKWMIEGFRNVIARDMGFDGVIVPAAVLLAAAAVFFLFAVRRFKVVV
jgi:ABC-2 type transport system permease protein